MRSEQQPFSWVPPFCYSATPPLDNPASLIEVVSQRLGHASIGVSVERYLHVYRSRDADAADAFGRLVEISFGSPSGIRSPF